ncbi:hypothetical protein EXE43_19725 [Halorubrum sp. SS5]|nr:hypothetical protein EXE43_19725 [Halorubrum sp. SS5]
MSTSDESEESAAKLADQYFESVETEFDESRKAEVRESIEDSEERYERLAEDHGEDHKLVRKAKEVVEARRKKLEELKEAEKRIGTARNEFLSEVADEFEFTEEWLEERVIEAVSHALYNQRDSSYQVLAEEIRTSEDLSDFDELERLELSAVVTILAKDALGQTEKVREQYERLEDSKSFAAFKVLCEHGSMSSEDAANKLGKSNSDVNNWLKSPINFWDRLIPFYRPEKGMYGLSTTGKYFREHYYEGQIDIEDGPDSEPDEEVSVEASDGSSDQATLTDTTSTSAEETTTKEEPITDGSDPETTEEKANRMFSNIGDQEED